MGKLHDGGQTTSLEKQTTLLYAYPNLPIPQRYDHHPSPAKTPCARIHTGESLVVIIAQPPCLLAGRRYQPPIGRGTGEAHVVG